MNMQNKQETQRNKYNAFLRECANQTPVASGKLTIERHNDEDSWITYGFEDLMLWDVNRQKHISLGSNDKFKVTAEDYETAKSEFWARWSIFTKRAFNLPYIKIETTNI